MTLLRAARNGRQVRAGLLALVLAASAQAQTRPDLSALNFLLGDWDAIELPERQRMVRQRLGVRCSLAIPLLRDGEAIGALVLFRKPPGGFDDGEVALAESFRDQALIAIQNARLFNETQEALARQTATADILRVMAWLDEVPREC